MKNAIEVKEALEGRERVRTQETATESLTLCRDLSSATHRVRNGQGTMGPDLSAQLATRGVPRSAEGSGK